MRSLFVCLLPLAAGRSLGNSPLLHDSLPAALSTEIHGREQTISALVRRLKEARDALHTFVPLPAFTFLLPALAQLGWTSSGNARDAVPIFYRVLAGFLIKGGDETEAFWGAFLANLPDWLRQTKIGYRHLTHPTTVSPVGRRFIYPVRPSLLSAPLKLFLQDLTKRQLQEVIWRALFPKYDTFDMPMKVVTEVDVKVAKEAVLKDYRFLQENARDLTIQDVLGSFVFQILSLESRVQSVKQGRIILHFLGHPMKYFDLLHGGVLRSVHDSVADLAREQFRLLEPALTAKVLSVLREEVCFENPRLVSSPDDLQKELLAQLLLRAEDRNDEYTRELAIASLPDSSYQDTENRLQAAADDEGSILPPLLSETQKKTLALYWKPAETLEQALTNLYESGFDILRGVDVTIPGRDAPLPPATLVIALRWGTLTQRRLGLWAEKLAQHAATASPEAHLHPWRPLIDRLRSRLPESLRGTFTESVAWKEAPYNTNVWRNIVSSAIHTLKAEEHIDTPTEEEVYLKSLYDVASMALHPFFMKTYLPYSSKIICDEARNQLLAEVIGRRIIHASQSSGAEFQRVFDSYFKSNAGQLPSRLDIPLLDLRLEALKSPLLTRGAEEKAAAVQRAYRNCSAVDGDGALRSCFDRHLAAIQ